LHYICQYRTPARLARRFRSPNLQHLTLHFEAVSEGKYIPSGARWIYFANRQFSIKVRFVSLTIFSAFPDLM